MADEQVPPGQEQPKKRRRIAGTLSMEELNPAGGLGIFFQQPASSTQPAQAEPAFQTADSSTVAPLDTSTTLPVQPSTVSPLQSTTGQTVENLTGQTVENSEVEHVEYLKSTKVERSTGQTVGSSKSRVEEMPTFIKVRTFTGQQVEMENGGPADLFTGTVYGQYILGLARQLARNQGESQGPKPQQVTVQLYPEQDFELDQLKATALEMLWRAGILVDKRKFDKSVFVREAVAMWLGFLDALAQASEDPQLHEVLALWFKHIGTGEEQQ